MSTPWSLFKSSFKEQFHGRSKSSNSEQAKKTTTTTLDTSKLTSDTSKIHLPIQKSFTSAMPPSPPSSPSQSSRPRRRQSISGTRFFMSRDHGDAFPTGPEVMRRRKQFALDIPEILARVGYFIPQWSGYITPHFSPKQILRCARVSRHWYNVMMPLVWHTFDDTSRVPNHVLERYLHMIRVLVHKHNFGGKSPALSGCTNLVQLTVSPWISGLEELLKANKRLVKVSWVTGGSSYNKISDTNLEAISQLPRLQVLEISGCQLDHLKLLIVLRALGSNGKGLTTLRLTNVKFMDTASSLLLRIAPGRFELIEKTYVDENVYLLELQASHGLVLHPNLIHFVSRCHGLERLQIDGDLTAIKDSPNQLLAECLTQFCPRFKYFSYKADKICGLSKTPILFPASTANGYIQAMNAKELGPPAPPPDKVGQPWWPIGFDMDCLLLSADMAQAVTSLDFLDTVQVTLFRTNDVPTLISNLTIAVEILTTCRHLRIFQLEYASILQFKESMLSPSQACFLFLQPWACSNLEQFAYNGIKRPVVAESSSEVFVRGQAEMFLPLKMNELFIDVTKARQEWMYESSHVRSRRSSLQEGEDEAEKADDTSDAGSVRTTILADIQALQHIILKQIQQLKRFRTLRLNGQERSDFSEFYSV
ncbi:hypothetical protein BGZ94_008677 [Podila epigama]|nr:hypothetical protein BGZ94_008677 [Podila epigama]